MRDLNELEKESIFIIREAMAQFKNPAVLWSTGKDSSAMLYLIRKAFFGKIPIPVIHLDTSFKFPEIYEFRDKMAKKWGLNLIVWKNKEALEKGMDPSKGKFECCSALKTEALKQVLRKHKFDALIMSIRRDEHHMRNLERFFSPRDKEFKWHFIRTKTKEELKKGDAPFVAEQDTEMSGWGIYASDFGPDCSHVRVHPILSWTELDVWRYIQRENITSNPLYFSRNGKRFRSLGCAGCTDPIDSDAKTIEEIIQELKTTDTRERAGRSQDKEQVMRRLRSMGYM